MDKSLLNSIAGLTKEQMIALWEASQKEENKITNVNDWLDYLDNLPDESGFNHVVANCLLRVNDKIAKELGGFDKADEHFDEVKKLTKEMALYLPELKSFFPNIRTKKQMNEHDWSIYKFD